MLGRRCAILAAALALAPAVRAQEPRPSRVAPLSERLVRALRESREHRERPAEETIAVLADGGLEALPPLLDVLVARELPPLDEDDDAQILSQPQRQMMLAAFARWPARTVVAAMEARLADGITDGERIAALYVDSAVGKARDLERALALAFAPGERDLPKDRDAALRTAFTEILKRDPAGYRQLYPLLHGAPAHVRGSILFAAADTRDARAMPLFTQALSVLPELADVALAQVRLLNRSSDVETNRALASEVRRYLSDDRVERRCAAARAAGELRDPFSVPALCAMLASDSQGLESSALWALKRLSGVALAPTRAAWMTWYESEQHNWDRMQSQVARRLDHCQVAERFAALAEISGEQLFRDDAALVLAPSTRDGDEGLRTAACEALGRLGSPCAYPALLDALQDDSERVRAAAAAALEQIAGHPLPTDAGACRGELGV